MGDYVRQMPHHGSRDMAKRPTAAMRFHIDVPLLLLLMALTAYGLVVLYSASGENMDPLRALRGRTNLIDHLTPDFRLAVTVQPLQPVLFLGSPFAMMNLLTSNSNNLPCVRTNQHSVVQ